MSKNCPQVRCFSCHGYGHVGSHCAEDLQCLYCFEVGHTEKRCAERLDDQRKEQEKEKEMESQRQASESIDQEKDNTVENDTNGDQGENDSSGVTDGKQGTIDRGEQNVVEEMEEVLAEGDLEDDDREEGLLRPCEDFNTMDWSVV